MPDKVKFGIKNVHIFKQLTDGPTWDDPIALPGAVNLSLNAQGEISKFFADNVVYYQTSSNNGYEGDLEVALITDEILEEIFNYTKDSTTKILTENATKNVAPFAMTFEEEGDSSGTKFVLYNCTATRPSRNLQTVEESKTPVTQTLTISAAPLADGNVLAMSTADTPASDLAAWHTAVPGYPEPTPPPPNENDGDGDPDPEDGE